MLINVSMCVGVYVRAYFVHRLNVYLMVFLFFASISYTLVFLPQVMCLQCLILHFHAKYCVYLNSMGLRVN